MACIPARNRNVFSYQASLPHTISVEIPIGKANILTFHQKTQKPRDQHRGIVSVNRGILRLGDMAYVEQATKEQ